MHCGFCLLEDNVTSIACPKPGCTGGLNPEYCRPILLNDIYDRWGKALCETMNYFYCPFADCSALLIREEQDENDESQCPHCERVVCAKCNCVRFLGMSNLVATSFRGCVTRVKMRWWKSLPRKISGGSVRNATTMLRKQTGACTLSAGVDMPSVTIVE